MFTTSLELKLWLPLLILALSVQCQYKICTINCPNEVITRNGTFPDGLLDFPPNYTCVLRFEVPSGFVLRFSLSQESTINQTENMAFVTNSFNKTLHFPKYNPFSQIFSTAGTASLHLKTKNETVMLLIKYDFIDVRNYTGTVYNAGNYSELNFPDRTFITFKANDPHVNGRILLNPVTIHSEENQLSDVYVFDGANLEGECLGTLADFEYKKSVSVYFDQANETATFLSIVHFNKYINYDGFYVISNTEKSLEKYSEYQVVIISKTNNQFILEDFSNLSSAITIIALDFEDNYIDSLEFLKGNGSLGITPMTPSHNSKVIITYDNSTYSSHRLMPLQIPAKIFTIVVTQATVTFKVVTIGGYTTWSTPKAGRHITIYSPCLWDNNAPAGFEYDFYKLIGEDMGYTVKVKSLIITRAKESFKSGIGYSLDRRNTTVVSCKHGFPMCSENFSGNLTATGWGTWTSIAFNAAKCPSSVVVEVDMYHIEGRNIFEKFFERFFSLRWMLP